MVWGCVLVVVASPRAVSSSEVVAAEAVQVQGKRLRRSARV
jgi:hypothetical protein